LPNSHYDVKNVQKIVVEDGVTVEMNEHLIYTLKQAIEIKELGFFTDSFKYLTRNYEKLLKVIEYLIENNSSCCTFNYYISNCYIYKRNKILRPSHKSREVNFKFQKNKEVTSKHKKYLELWKEIYLSSEK